MKFNYLFCSLSLALGGLSESVLANDLQSPDEMSCIKSHFSSIANTRGRTISITLKNHCDAPVYLENKTLRFQQNSDLNTVVWTQFDPLSPPEHSSRLTTKAQEEGGFMASITLPVSKDGAALGLAAGQSLNLVYDAPNDDYLADTVSIVDDTSSAVGGRIISYIPGWKTPPPASDLAAAGYTHAVIAFGVFSTKVPGQITPIFSTISKDYIKSLQKAGIKVLLSLGGASTNTPKTSVNFHQVLASAASPTVFEQTFVSSLEQLVKQYHFDGFDFDIEEGINAGGTFTKPVGDIAVLARIINNLHAKHPALLISMAPQIPNISTTRLFNQTWGNYASLIMQTHAALSWVGMQLYNTGCTFGIDGVCYDPKLTNSPNFSVAMATDLLADWPSKNAAGQPTRFQAYKSYLNPSQVVLGYPVANARGQGDGSPVTPITTIKRAIQCLRTKIASSKSCGSYVPPKAYPGIGGVFNWEVTYDQNNAYRFAKGLKACVSQGNCN